MFAMHYSCRDTLRFLSGITIPIGLKIHGQQFGSLSLISTFLSLICLMASEDLRTAGEYFQDQITCYLSHGADKCIDDDEIPSVPCVASTWF